MKDYNAFFNCIKNKCPEEWFLMEGCEEFTKEKGLKDLLGLFSECEFADMNITVLTNPDAGKLIAACETLPFMADKRLVVVKECGMFLAGKSKDYDEDDSVQKISDYLPHFPSSTVLCFYVRGKAETRKKLYNVFKKADRVYSFDTLSDAQLSVWLRQRFRGQGKQIDEELCQRLCFMVGKDLNTLNNEACKLCDYLGSREALSAEDIDSLCTKSAEYKVFDLSDALLSGQAGKAFAILDALQKEDPSSGLMLVSLLGRQCRQMLYASVYTDRLRAAKELGVPSFIAEKLIRQADAFTKEQLRDLPRLCIDTEFRVKSGQIPEQDAVRNLMIHILAMKENKN